jgi:glycerol-3-phosphate acyltransferase PlsY
MYLINPFLMILASYLIGAIPFSYFSSRLKGADPKKMGTTNIGASNALFIAGPLAGLMGLVGDVAKGFFVVEIAQSLLYPDWVVACCGIAAVIGHDFSIFLRFAGGKGVATSGGALLAIDPIFTLLIVLLWLLMVLVFRYFIPSTLFVFMLLPFIMWLGSFRREYIFFAVVAALLAFYVHRYDIERFLSGKELKIRDTLEKYNSK